MSGPHEGIEIDLPDPPAPFHEFVELGELSHTESGVHVREEVAEMDLRPRPDKGLGLLLSASADHRTASGGDDPIRLETHHHISGEANHRCAD